MDNYVKSADGQAMFLFFFCIKQKRSTDPREDAGGLSREYILRIPSVS